MGVQITVPTTSQKHESPEPHINQGGVREGQSRWGSFTKQFQNNDHKLRRELFIPGFTRHKYQQFMVHLSPMSGRCLLQPQP